MLVQEAHDMSKTSRCLIATVIDVSAFAIKEKLQYDMYTVSEHSGCVLQGVAGMADLKNL